MELGLLVWAVVGLLAGGLAGVGATRGSYGILGDMLLGLLGSFLATLLLELLRLSSHPASFASIIVALGGAAAAILAQRQLWPPGV